MTRQKNIVVESNFFKSKSLTLKLLKKQLKKSKIEDIFDFTVEQWINNENLILQKITKSFSTNIIIRSSAIGEDSIEKSQAGNYLSILNIDPKSKSKVKSSIQSVINSYKNKKNFNKKNQILIQTQTKNIKISGVIFTRTPDIGSPYYIVNYETTGATDGVTKGVVNNTIKIFRNSKLNKSQRIWKSLLDSIKEIEQVVNNSLLDIEFGITKSNKVVIFQVRPITTINSKNIIEDSKIEKLIESSKKQFNKKNYEKSLFGKYTVFSDMADWNPAEIIGHDTNVLDYSLYDFLIMDYSWHKGREIIGYQKTSINLMTRFGNKPYVDIRASFNSLIPDNINKKLKNKLIEFYFKKLEKYPYLHDKIEFEILFTCYEPFFQERLNELKSYNFKNSEIKILKQNLLEFTNKLINNFHSISEECNNSINQMKNNRIKIINKLSKSSRKNKDLFNASELLLKDCKSLGTIYFSTMARIAFIASIILKNLVRSGHVSEKFLDEFMNSINSPLSQFQNDQINYMKKKITKKQFLQKYGHLRPGTYDITATRYDKDSRFLQNMELLNFKQTKKNPIKFKNLDEIFKKSGLIFSEVDFYDFVKNSIVQREEMKFQFTKNLSDALEYIAEAGKNLGFTRDELSNLEIKTIINDPKNLKIKTLTEKWNNKIQKSKEKHSLNKNMILPPIISSNDDFSFISYPYSKPNFITSKKLFSELLPIKKIDNLSILKEKIILLENADPGYDWIFSYHPSGLITKYGGVASHMAIRCAELGLPAAIGCGELLYEKLKHASKINLDCQNSQIIILEQTKSDKYADEKRVLKSLGYIR